MLDPETLAAIRARAERDAQSFVHGTVHELWGQAALDRRQLLAALAESERQRQDYEREHEVCVETAARERDATALSESLRTRGVLRPRLGPGQRGVVLMTPLDAKTLAAIRARAEAATKGPWVFRVGKAAAAPDYPVMIGAVAPGHRIMANPPGGSYPSRDAEFIAHARADVPRLLAALAESERQRQDYEREHEVCVETAARERDAMMDQLLDRAEAAEASATHWQTEAARYRAALEFVEFVADVHGDRCCAWCGEYEPRHIAECQRQAALASGPATEG